MRPEAAGGSGKAVRNEVVGFRRPGSGEILWIYGSAIPQFDSDGSVRRIIATLTDMTERKSGGGAGKNERTQPADPAQRAGRNRGSRSRTPVRGLESVHGADDGSRQPRRDGETSAGRPAFSRRNRGRYAKIQRALLGEVSSSLELPIRFRRPARRDGATEILLRCETRRGKSPAQS